MEIEQLLDETAEPQLAAWLRKWPNALEALNNIADLFVDLHENCILGQVSEQVSISGPVHIGKGTKIHPFATIQGPVIIGENVSVRAHSIIRSQAYIGSDCVVGHSADVKRSICLNGAKMQCGIFLGDSVLGCGARIGSGVIIANRKFDQAEVYVKDKVGSPLRKSGREFFGAIIGRYCRLGANVVTYPGTIIREHTWVGAGCILHGAYGPDEFVSVKQQLDIRPKKRLNLRSGKGAYEHV
jgi:UDP-N-acetylglucosamine diphosphorylase / glucose-1-phosphate thymidylyltransferase / UDP-N-acetylgalactosamine diphosphorylase / glucosamine-1-phosphate N-acetyltransferase / galactosamine-1-phosphate N-acetyltransferase